MQADNAGHQASLIDLDAMALFLASIQERYCKVMFSFVEWCATHTKFLTDAFIRRSISLQGIAFVYSSRTGIEMASVRGHTVKVSNGQQKMFVQVRHHRNYHSVTHKVICLVVLFRELVAIG